MQGYLDHSKNLLEWQLKAKIAAGPEFIRHSVIHAAEKRMPRLIDTHTLERSVRNVGNILEGSSIYASTTSIFTSALRQLGRTAHGGRVLVEDAEVLRLIGGNRTVSDLCEGLQAISRRLEQYGRDLAYVPANENSDAKHRRTPHPPSRVGSIFRSLFMFRGVLYDL